MAQLIVAECKDSEYFSICALEEFIFEQQLLSFAAVRAVSNYFGEVHPGMSYCPQAERDNLFGKLKKLYDSGMFKKFEKLFYKVRKHLLAERQHRFYSQQA